MLAKDISLSKIIVHFDSLIVVDYENDISLCAVIEPVIEDCKVLLKEFSVSVVLFVGRDRNFKAHSLVGIGNVVCSKTWFGYIQSFVSPFCFFSLMKYVGYQN